MALVFPRRPGPDEIARDAEAVVPLARLATLSESLAAQPLGPSAAFRERLRAQLLAEAKAAADPFAIVGTDPAGLAPVRSLERHRRPVLRGAAAGVALVLVGGGVAAASAQGSLPGDPLYPLKRWTESVQTAADPQRDAPSHVLEKIDVRLSELERSSRLGAAGAPTGVPLDRWPAMLTALSDLDGDLARLGTREPDPAITDALAQRRQRLVGVLPALLTQQQPAVENLVAAIDAITLRTGAGGVLSQPSLLPGSPVAMLVGGVDGVIASMRQAQAAAAAATAPSSKVAGRPLPTSGSVHPPVPTPTTPTPTTPTPTPQTRTAAEPRTTIPGSSRLAATTANRTPLSTAYRSSTPRTTSAMVRTVTVTVTTVTTRTTGVSPAMTAGSTSAPATTAASTTVSTAVSTVRQTTSTTTRTVSTVTRTVTTSVLPTTGLTSALGGH